MRGAWLSLAAALLSGCGEAESPPVAACPANALVTASGCVPVGVTSCAAGFVADAAGSCAPVLPTEPCAGGDIAWLGETSCHPLAPCGDGPWGDIPSEAGTIFVAAGSAGDGSEAAPFGSISEAIAAAPPGALIAIAEGQYVEDLVVSKPLRLWGRCPDRVTVVGAGAFFAIDISNTVGVEVRGLSVTGPSIGISVSGAEDVVVDHVRIHDTGHYGFDAEDVLGVTSVSISELVVERASLAGVFLSEASVTASDVLVRDTQPAVTGQFGRGINIEGEDKGNPIVIEHCIVQRNHEAGVVAQRQPLTLSACLIEDGLPSALDGTLGRGISAQQMSLEVIGSVVRRNLAQAVFVANGSASIRETVLRDTESDQVELRHGAGVAAQFSTVTLSSCLVVDNRDFGLSFIDGGAEVAGCAIAGTRVAADGKFGDGIVAAVQSQPPSVSLDSSIIIGSERAGIASFGAAVQLAGSALSCNAIDLNGEAKGVHDFEYADLGDNVCGCDGAADPCSVASVGLEPPGPLDP